METTPHIVAVAAFDGVVPFDLATPCEVFERVTLRAQRSARLPAHSPADSPAHSPARPSTQRPAKPPRTPSAPRSPYEVRVCGVSPEVDAKLFQLKTHYGMGSLERADTVFVPGVADLDRPVPAKLVRAIIRAAARGARIASICTGAFVLAQTKLLDGGRATTHWLACDELQRRHPSIEVDPSVLYVDNGSLLTSAGAAAGLDLCLHMIRCDYGASVAADVARASVMPLERAGGQAQFIAHRAPVSNDGSLQPLLGWLAQHLHHDIALEVMARRAGMSTRSLHRRFREQTGTTPAQWLLHARVRHAQQLLETTTLSIEQVCDRAGFGAAATFRERFRKVVGTSPSAYRRAFR